MTNEQPAAFRESQEKLRRKAQLEGVIEHLNEDLAGIDEKLSNPRIQQATARRLNEEMEEKVAARTQYQHELDEIELWFNNLTPSHPTSNVESTIHSPAQPSIGQEELKTLKSWVFDLRLLIGFGFAVIVLMLIVNIAYEIQTRDAIEDLSPEPEVIASEETLTLLIDEAYAPINEQLVELSNDHNNLAEGQEKILAQGYQVDEELTNVKLYGAVLMKCPANYENVDPSTLSLPCIAT